MEDPVDRAELVEANGKLEISQSLGLTAGPGIGGALVELVTAPLAIVVDAVSFLCSAFLVMRIRIPEPPVSPRQRGTTLRADVTEGLSVILKHPLLRPMAGCSATMNLFMHALFAVLLLYVVRDLALPATSLGIVVGALGLGGVAGAPLASRAARRFGAGRTIVRAAMLPGVGALLSVIAEPTAALVTVALLALSQFVLGFSATVYSVNSVSLRQAIAPDHLRGRINASNRFLIWGTMPIGSLLGGGLAELMGLRFVLALAAIGFVLASGWVVFSPISRIREIA